MDPLVDNARAAMRLSPRKLAIAGAAAVLVVAVIVVVFLLVSSKDDLQGPDEVSTILVEAIAATSPAATAPGSGGTTAGFDTSALRTRLQEQLDGWLIDLAAGDGASRIGIAARQVQGAGCVFAWSDVGAPRSATVTDPALPCEAEIALVAAKRPV